MSDITFSVKKYFDGTIPFDEAAEGADVEADSLKECTSDEKKQISEWIQENYWQYLDEMTEAENELLRIADPVEEEEFYAVQPRSFPGPFLFCTSTTFTSYGN